MNFITRYFNKRRESKALVDAALEFYKAHLDQTVAEEMSLSEKMNSSTPYVENISEQTFDLDNPDDSDPAHIRYRYNDAFVSNLRKTGYVGTEAEIISKWEADTVRASIQKVISDELDRLRNSDKPWVRVEAFSANRDDETSSEMRTEFDWNKSFVTLLRQNGYSGSNEDIIVYKWFKAVAEIIAVDIHGEKYDV